MSLLDKKVPKKLNGLKPVQLLEPDQIKALSDKELVKYRHKILVDRKVTGKDHWDQMWTCNAEMAKRFKKIVEER